MNSFKSLQPRRAPLSTPAAPTSRLLQPSRLLVPTKPSTSKPAAPLTQEQCERAARLGHSFETIAIFSPPTNEVESATIPHFPTVQRKAVLPSPLQERHQLQSRIQAARSKGRSLDKHTQQRLEQGLGTSLSGVRIHTDSEADHLSRSINAVAFTTGPNIFFRSGAYHPSSSQGLHLLAHEVTHVVQQAAGPVSGTPMARGVSVSNPGDRFEQAAEASATQISAGTSIDRATINSAHKLSHSLSVPFFTTGPVSPYKLGNPLGQSHGVIQRFATDYTPDPHPDPYTGAAHIVARIGKESGWPGGQEPTGGIPKVIDHIGSPIKGRYVAGHLMNEEIAGKADNANLTVLTVGANNLHKGYEKKLKDMGYYAGFIERFDVSLTKKYGDKAYEHGADYEVRVISPKPDGTENYPDEKLLVSGLDITISPIRRKIGSTGPTEPWPEMKSLEVKNKTVPNVPPYPAAPGTAPAKPKPAPKSTLKGDPFDYSTYGSGYNPIRSSKSGRTIKPTPYSR